MSEEYIERLIDEGADLLDEEEFDAAIEVGEKLLAKRHSSGFEILALAHDGLGDTERAVEVLEDGIEKAPSVWLLWQLLGNYRSDLGLYAKAHEAYEAALECPHVQESSVHLNRSIALVREERFDEAMEALSQIEEDDELSPRAESQRLDILNCQGKHEEVIDRGERLLARLTAEADDEVWASVQVEVGQAYWQGRNNTERALDLAWEALGHDKAKGTALWLIRSVESHVSHEAKYYRLLVEGEWYERDDNGEELGFFTTYDVIADNIEEAMVFIRSFEPDEVASSLRLDEYEMLGAEPTEPKGVCDYSDHALFPRESED